jgi:hypothetical protein
MSSESVADIAPEQAADIIGIRTLEGPALLHRARLMPSRHARLLPCRDRSEKPQQNPLDGQYKL